MNQFFFLSLDTLLGHTFFKIFTTIFVSAVMCLASRLNIGNTEKGLIIGLVFKFLGGFGLCTSNKASGSYSLPIFHSDHSTAEIIEAKQLYTFCSSYSYYPVTRGKSRLFLGSSTSSCSYLKTILKGP